MKIRRAVFILTSIILIASIIWTAFFVWKNFRGAGPAFSKPSQDITNILPSAADNTSQNPPSFPASENKTNFPLSLPAGFRISIFAKNLPGARVMAFDGMGNMWVSRPSANVITLLEIQNGKATIQNDTLAGLNRPHGLAFDPDNPNLLYIAEENKVVRVPLYTEANYQKIADLPSDGIHTTRTLLFGKDKRLYVSVGSSCNVCAEGDPRRAAISSMNKDGSDFRQFATGLRNAVFMVNNPSTGEIWATDMGRDFLGDNLPPDTINIIREGKNYGWPYCYGKQVHDSNFDPSGAKIELCKTTEPSFIDIPAHSAPLGLAFVTNKDWPADYQNNLLVAYHGSWNRSVPAGYKIVRFKFDQNGNYLGAEDFITGWLTGSQNALGRPVDIVEGPDGKIFVSDDKAGVIYLVEWIRN